MSTGYKVQVASPSEIMSYGRPINVNKKTGQVFVQNGEGMVALSSLRKDEWEALDQAVIAAARQYSRGWPDLRAAGLIKPSDLGTLISQWSLSSEMSEANEDLTGTTRGERGKVEFNLAGVPVPVIFKEFDIPRRVLLASRKMGDGIDTTSAFEAGQRVAEKRESNLFLGSSVTLNGNTLYGYTNHPDRIADTATNFGGGDWSTATNIIPTIAGMVSALRAARHRGPFQVYLANDLYDLAALQFPDTANNQTFVDRMKALSGITGVDASDELSTGNILVVQMTQNVVDAVEAADVQVVEWTSGDGMTSHFKVMAVAAARIKSDYNERSGVAHATGA